MKIMNRSRIKEKVADDTIYVIGGSAASLLIGNTRMFYPAVCVSQFAANAVVKQETTSAVANNNL